MGVGDTGAVDDAANRHGAFGVAFGQQSLHRDGRTDVQRHGFDGDAAHLQRPDGVDLLLGVDVVGVAVPVAPGWQRGTAGQDHPAGAVVGEPAGRQQTERTETAGDQVGRIRAAPQRLADRLAGHRREAGCQELAVAQRQDRLRRGRQHRSERRHQRIDRGVLRQVDQTAPQLRLLGPDDAGGPPHRALRDRGVRTTFAHTAGDDPQRGRVTLVPLGQSADQIDQLHRHPHGAVDIAFTGPGFRDIEDVSRLGGSG